MITGQEFEVIRRVYLDFEGISLRRKFLTGLEPEIINVMIGKHFLKIYFFVTCWCADIAYGKLMCFPLLHRFLTD